MSTLPSPEGGKDLLEQKVEAGTQDARSSAAKVNEHAEASYAIVRKLRESAPKIGEAVKGFPVVKSL